jgi:pimeloyl-ACP methyl ester carboxylesterase
MTTLPNKPTTNKPQRLLVYLLLVSVLSGCMFLRLKEDVSWLNSATKISGSIKGASTPEGVVVVALVRAGDHQDYIPETYTVRYGNGSFELLNREGSFYLMAFEDQNEDLKFQPGEPVGWWGEPTALVMGKKAKQDDLDIELLSAAQAQKELPQIYADDLPPVLIARDTINLGTQAQLTDPQFEPEIGSMGMWEPVKHVQAGHSGLYFLEPFDANKTPVLFIHGISGTGRVWRRLIRRIDRTQLQPWVLNYPSGASLSLLSETINGLLNELQVKYGFSKLAVVGHSMGGLVARDIVNRNLAQGRRATVRQLITISTPWGGHAAAQRAANAPISVPAWQDMAPGSAYLQALLAPPLPAPVPFDLVFGYQGSSLFLAGNSDGTIALSSLLAEKAQDQARQLIAFDEDHVSILKSAKVAARINRLLLNFPAAGP